jgi:N-acylglucosamine 2-epimerase
MKMIDEKWIDDIMFFYNNHLNEVILKYWLNRADDEYGGFFTCYNNTGEQQVSTDKFVWSQGRLTWIYSKLGGVSAVKLDDTVKRRCRELAAGGADFLINYCILPDGNCAFQLDRRGNPKEPWKGSGYAVSTFADCFVIMGLAACAELTGNRSLLETGLKLFRSAALKLRNGTFKNAPAVLPAGWRSHAAHMIILNAGQELYRVLRLWGYDAETAETENVCQEVMSEIVNHFVTDSGIVLEYLDSHRKMLDPLYGRHINPGHTNESMWIVIREAERLGRDDLISKAAHTVLVTSRIAWDKEFGGMYYYLDRDGSAPHGLITDETRGVAENIVRDWSSKLWWPHTETVYANLLCYAMRGDAAFFEEYQRYQDYTFKIFPNPDSKVGEWIQIRDRQGRPGNPNVGGRLPVKDPYHTLRNLLLLVELLEKMKRNRIGCPGGSWLKTRQHEEGS